MKTLFHQKNQNPNIQLNQNSIEKKFIKKPTLHKRLSTQQDIQQSNFVGLRSSIQLYSGQDSSRYQPINSPREKGVPNNQFTRKIIYQNKNLMERIFILQKEYMKQKQNCIKYKKLYEQLKKQLVKNHKKQDRRKKELASQLLDDMSEIKQRNEQFFEIKKQKNCLETDEYELDCIKTLLNKLQNLEIKKQNKVQNEWVAIDNEETIKDSIKRDIISLQNENNELRDKIMLLQKIQVDKNEQIKLYQNQNKLLKRKIQQLKSILINQQSKFQNIKTLFHSKDKTIRKSNKNQIH